MCCPSTIPFAESTGQEFVKDMMLMWLLNAHLPNRYLINLIAAQIFGVTVNGAFFYVNIYDLMSLNTILDRGPPTGLEMNCVSREG